MSKRNDYIRQALVDTLCTESSVVITVRADGTEARETMPKTDALALSGIFKAEGYHETEITKSMRIYTQVNNKGKVR